MATSVWSSSKSNPEAWPKTRRLVGDVIVGVNGSSIGEPHQLADALRTARDFVRLTFLRGDHSRKLQVNIALGEQLRGAA